MQYRFVTDDLAPSTFGRFAEHLVLCDLTARVLLVQPSNLEGTAVDLTVYHPKRGILGVQVKSTGRAVLKGAGKTTRRRYTSKAGDEIVYDYNSKGRYEYKFGTDPSTLAYIDIYAFVSRDCPFVFYEHASKVGKNKRGIGQKRFHDEAEGSFEKLFSENF